jgi:hypothetical protein
MNFLLGLLFGVFVTIGAAYVHDASVGGVERHDPRLIVNWDALDADIKGLRDDVAEGWSRLTGRGSTGDERSARGSRVTGS